MNELLAFAAATVRRAGDMALAYHGKGSPTVKFDSTLVTALELHLSEFFREQVTARYPSHQVFPAESALEGYTHDERRFLWIFDPIDGVANLQAGIPIWGMSLALLENHWPIFGLYYMPKTGDFFEAVAGSASARWCGIDVQVSRQPGLNDESLLLTYSRFHQRYRTTFPGKIRNFGCTGAHICYVAMGRADAAIIYNAAFHDLAVGRLIVEAAGGKILHLDGREITLDSVMGDAKIAEDLLVLPPHLLDPVRQCLNPPV
jgi:myo-inositol-1(or 4)-monophosphatase